MARPVKETSSRMSSLAARVMKGYYPTREEVVSMAASLLSQDITQGNGIHREADDPE